ncbi:MAG: hypothetical protein COW84_11380 [Gammaproteobacteria bacterium CG22_combo_CG10-13_8_21_14_all_40_8]|nr:MAG: hypothetical protein COW84_11380 [Gammaproteobacteria bacterium CG22_combo_CG10-13_8_21_14_all_40_8]
MDKSLLFSLLFITGCAGVVKHETIYNLGSDKYLLENNVYSTQELKNKLKEQRTDSSIHYVYAADCFNSGLEVNKLISIIKSMDVRVNKISTYTDTVSSECRELQKNQRKGQREMSDFSDLK